MANIAHKLLTGTNLHTAGYVQSTDPGAVGAGMLWIDTSGGTGLWITKVRNATNTDWEMTGGGGSGDSGYSGFSGFSGAGGSGGGSSYIVSFDNTSLISGKLSINHLLNNRVLHVVVYDENYKVILPDETISTGADTMQIDLSSYGAISGTWYIRVSI
jgi:hypothetical protein